MAEKSSSHSAIGTSSNRLRKRSSLSRRACSLRRRSVTSSTEMKKKRVRSISTRLMLPARRATWLSLRRQVVSKRTDWCCKASAM